MEIYVKDNIKLKMRPAGVPAFNKIEQPTPIHALQTGTSILQTLKPSGAHPVVS